MIHVCRIDIGDRYVFDMTHGIDDVKSLKQAIEQRYSVQISNQILLISGGSTLNNSKQKLFGLSAGIEESPIYLIDIENVRHKGLAVNYQQVQSNKFDSQSLLNDIDIALNLKPCLNTLQARTQLSKRLHEYDVSLSEQCDSFYYDQFWQYQGFLALIANLNDSITNINKIYENLKVNYEEFMLEKCEHSKTIQEIDVYLEKLAQIRLLPQLVKHASTNTNLFITSVSTQSISNLTQEHMSDNNMPLNTLLDWSNSTDPRHKLELVIENAKSSINQIDDTWLQAIEQEVNQLLIQSDNEKNKDVAGLTTRLNNLNILLNDMRELLSKQFEFHDSFKANHTRATNLRDDSIVHQLCISHVEQLKSMRENHLKMIDITNKIYRAKCELIGVINLKLKWVMELQKDMLEKTHLKILAYTQKVKKSRYQLKQFEQLKKAPYVYFESLNEIKRREQFSSVYKQFAREVYQMAHETHKEEMRRREKFNEKFRFSYVANLFPYLNDSVIGFLKPELNLMFDTNLPHLNSNEIIKLEEEVNLNSDTELKEEYKSENISLIENLNKSIEKLKTKNDQMTSASETELIDGSTELVNEVTDTNDQMVLVSTKPMANQEFLKKLNEIYTHDLSSMRQLVNQKDEIQVKLNEFKEEMDSFKKIICLELTKKNDKKQEFYDSLIETLFATNTSEKSIKFSDNLDEQLYTRMKENLLKLRETYEKTVEETRKNAETYKLSIMAEKQKYFMDAIERVKLEKEKKFDELKQVNANLLKQLESVKPMQSLASSPDTYLKDKVEQLEKLVDYYKGQLSTRSASVVSLNPNSSLLPNTGSMITTQLTALPTTKEYISLDSCDLDELVLVVYDVIHCSYKIINHSSTHMHFVNSDCLKEFDMNSTATTSTSTCATGTSSHILQSPSNSPSSPSHLIDYFSTLNAANVNELLRDIIGDACPHLMDNRNLNLTHNNRPIWFVARVTHRELCKARRDSNRFKLPNGTQFFRVKIKPYKI